jgi:uncharacterized membrane protein
MRKIILLILLSVVFSYPVYSQDLHQTIKGKVTDRETGEPLTGAYILEAGSSPSNITTTDATGNFRLSAGTGRVTIKITYVGYEDLLIKDILVASAKEVEINAELREEVIQTSDVIVSSDRSGNSSIDQMATISTNTIRTDDALRYAGGLFISHG